MKEHYIISIDRGRLQIYREPPLAPHFAPRLGVLESFDFPADALACADQPRPTADPFPSLRKRPSAHNGQDPRSRMLSAIAAEVDNFLQQHPEASWDFAAEPRLYDELIEQLSPDTQRRLKRVLSLDGMGETAGDKRRDLADAPLV